MPTHYTYKCTACNRTEERYRNARKSRCCHADVMRLTAVIKTQIELELEDCRGELQHMIAEAAKLRTEFFRLCPESLHDDRFFEMMGDPTCGLYYVTQWLQSVKSSDLTQYVLAGPTSILPDERDSCCTRKPHDGPSGLTGAST